MASGLDIESEGQKSYKLCTVYKTNIQGYQLSVWSQAHGQGIKVCIN